jgi:hypothetical protein
VKEGCIIMMTSPQDQVASTARVPSNNRFRRVALLHQQWLEKKSPYIDEELRVQYRWSNLGRNRDGSYHVHAQVVFVVHSVISSPTTGELSDTFKDKMFLSLREYLDLCAGLGGRRAYDFIAEECRKLQADDTLDVAGEEYLLVGAEQDLTM